MRLDVVKAYFNSEIVGECVPLTERMRGICFRPVHYFFSGNTYTWTDHGFDRPQDEKSYSTGSFPKTLIMAVCIVPGMLVGTVLAIAAYAQLCFKSIWGAGMMYPYTMCYEERLYMDRNEPAFELPLCTQPSASAQMNASYKGFALLVEQILKELTTASKWDDEDFCARYDNLMVAAYQQTVFRLNAIATASGRDPWKIADTMKNGTQPYETARYNIFELYRTARYCSVFRNMGENNKERIENIEAFHSKAGRFFSKDLKQYRWRRLHDAAWDHIVNYNGLKEQLFVTEHLPMQEQKDEEEGAD